VASQSGSRARTLGRRGLFSVIGAGALTAAAARFGTSAANADTNGCDGLCCYLAYCPPNKSWSTCESHASYIWSCTVDAGGLWCECCEMSGGSGQTCMYN
jgi:hypothetical protein